MNEKGVGFKMKEQDLFFPIKTYLQEQGYKDVYGEVCLFDVVGLSPTSEIIVEMKLQFSFHLVEQAYAARKYAKKVYVAVPKPKSGLHSHRFARKICSDYNIGIIYVDVEKQKVYKVFEPTTPNSNYKKRMSIRNRVNEKQKNFIGGSKTGDTDTLYSVMIADIKAYMKTRNWVSVKELVQNIDTHYANPEASIRSTLQKSWNTDWCENRIHNRKKEFRYKKQAI